MQKGEDKADAQRKLFGDNEYADKYGFQGVQFTKSEYWAIESPLVLDGGFDLNSVMLYGSAAYAEYPRACVTDLNWCPMASILRKTA